MKMLFEGFEISNKKILDQILGFEYNICFLECLQPVLDIEEAHLAYIVDQDLRMWGEFSPYHRPTIDLEIDGDEEN